MEQKLYTLQEVADLFRVSPRTVMNWARRGKINFICLPIGNLIRVAEDEVKRILAEGGEVRFPPEEQKVE